MKDICPKCKINFGFRGPMKKIEKNSKSFRKQVRYFCPSCSVEVYYYKPKLEHYLGFFGSIAIGFGALISLLQINPKLHALSKNIDLYSSVLGIIAIGVSILLDLLNQHYKIKDCSQPASPANAEDHAAD